MRLADGVLLVVDAAEGTMVVTEKVVKQALAEGLPITLLLNKARARTCLTPHRFLLGECTAGLHHAPRAAWLLLLFSAQRIQGHGRHSGVNLGHATWMSKMHAMP